MDKLHHYPVYLSFREWVNEAQEICIAAHTALANSDVDMLLITQCIYHLESG
jgi:hypothetical protein